MEIPDNQVLQELHALVDARLFGGRPWQPDRETLAALDRIARRMKLIESVPGKENTWGNTPLATRLNFDLFEVFMGNLDEVSVLAILWENGLITEDEYDEFCNDDWGSKGFYMRLERKVREAYFTFFNPRGRQH
jgi:hypothetical protein